MMTETKYAHIVRGDDGYAYLEGTPIKVVQIALDEIAYGWDADEMHRMHPHLSLGQLHSALAYYHDHKAEIERQIEERFRYAEEMRLQAGESPVMRKLRAMRQRT